MLLKNDKINYTKAIKSQIQNNNNNLLDLLQYFKVGPIKPIIDKISVHTGDTNMLECA